MSEQASIDMNVENVAVALERLAGKIGMLAVGVENTATLVGEMRDEQKTMRDNVNRIGALNIQERFIANSARLDALEARIAASENLHIASSGERKGVELSARLFYSLLALGGFGFFAVVGRLILVGSN